LYFSLLFVIAYQVLADCNNGVMVGSVTYFNGSSSETSYVALSGGTSWQGASASGNTITIKHNARAYLAADCVGSFQYNMYQRFYFLDKTLSFTVDLSQAGCGCNAALYLVSMPAYNSQNQPDPTKCGDYYCDANNVCGIFCPEMDVIEANTGALQITPHRCNSPQGKYYPYCDGGGCGQNVAHIDSQSYGPGSNYIINTENPFQVNMSFQTQGGNLDKIVTVLSQNSKTFQVVHDSGRCGNGYLGDMTEAFRQGMVVTMSYWGTAGDIMKWLDVPPCNINTNCNGGTVSFSNIRVY